jgi:hypothetical protein
MDLPWSLVMSSSGLTARRSVCSRCSSCAPFLFQQNLQRQKIRLTSFNYVTNNAPFDVFMLIISFTVSRREAGRLWQLS